MTDLLAARLQMALSLGFHIIFATIGIAMPFLMAVAHWRWIKTKDPVYLKLTKTWSRGVAIFFATGAVSGTVLSFELGLLWPKFMEHAGAIIGMPFSWEGTAFFLESIALGIFLYGWDRVNPKVHWISGLVVGISGVLSGLFVICANGWMNSPRGFELIEGQFQNIDPWAAMFNPSALAQGLHMTIAAFTATGFAAVGLHALGVLRNPKSKFHKKALEISLWVGSIAAILQPIQGDWLAKQVARLQPAKFAAMESLHETTKGAPFRVLGLEIPGLLSFLAAGDASAEVMGLDKISEELRPPVSITHLSFEIMILIGTLLFLTGILGIVALTLKKSWMFNKILLRFFVFCTPIGFIAIEAGWVVTEVGRQPWIIYGVMKTKDALTPVPGLVISLVLITGMYLFLTFVVAWLMRRQFKHVD